MISFACIVYNASDYIVVYKPDDSNAMKNSDLLLQQLVPQSYLVLQKAIKEKVIKLRASSKHPVLEKDEFLYDIQIF